MSMRLAAVLSLVAFGTAHAEPLDTMRRVPWESARGQLQRVGTALGLIQRMAEVGLWEAARDQLATMPEGVLLLSYLSGNEPRAAVVDLAVNAGAGTTDGGGAGDVTASIGARLAGDYCDVFGASLSVRGTVATEGGLSGGEGRASVGLCLWRGLYLPPGLEPELGDASMSLFPLRARAELAINATPRFSAGRNQPRTRFTEARYGFTLDGIRYMPSDPRRGVTFIYAGFEDRWEWPEVFAGDRGYETMGGFGFFRIFRTREPSALADRAIDILDFRLHGTRFDESVALIELHPLKISGLGLFSDQVLLDADLGLGLSGGEIRTSSCLDNVGCVEEVVATGDDVAEIATWVGGGGLSVGTRASGGGAGFSRTLDSNRLGQLAIENRVTGWYQRQDHGIVMRAEMFGGMARHYLDRDARGEERFFGAGLDAQVEVHRNLWVGAQIDGIRVFARDAVLDGRVAGSGLRAFGTLSWTFELTRRKIQLPLPTMEELIRKSADEAEPAPVDGEAPPAETPPAETPPAETPPAEAPPAETLPSESAPSDSPP